MDLSFLLILIGLAVGTFGSLVGAGGGFILMPILFFLYPGRPAAELTAISLAVVCMNAISGSVAYARKGRIDYRSGVSFALASAPGAVLGVLTTGYLSRELFDPIFAAFLGIVGVYLFLRPAARPKAPLSLEARAVRPPRILVERDGTRHELSYSMPLGLGISAAVGYLSSLLGIGGGIIHVPALVHLLRFPTYIATATSQFILGIMSLIGTVVHLFKGNLGGSLLVILFLGPGVIIGAQVGARLSTRIKAHWIMRTLALVLVLLSVRLLWR